MYPIALCVLVLLLCPGSMEMVVDRSRHTSGGSLKWHIYDTERGLNMDHNLKRHSDGTFTNDLSRYLDKGKAKDFVEWLTDSQQLGCHTDSEWRSRNGHRR